MQFKIDSNSSTENNHTRPLTFIIHETGDLSSITKKKTRNAVTHKFTAWFRIEYLGKAFKANNLSHNRQPSI